MMRWFKRKPQNRLRRHDLKGLDSKLRARVRQQRQMRFAFSALCATTVLLGAGWGVWSAVKHSTRKLFSENNTYQLTDIMIENSGSTLNSEFIQSYLRLRRGLNLLALDLGELRHELELLPVVEKAEFSRELPNRLVIRIMERVPIANIRTTTSNKSYQVDGYGMVIDLQAFQKVADDLAGRLQTLPTLVGARVSDVRIGRIAARAEVQQAIALIREVANVELGLDLDIREIDISRQGMLLAQSSDGTLLKFGMASIDKPLRRFAVVQEQARRNSKRIATADLTLERDVVVTLLPSN